VIRQENRGRSAARNTGLQASTGDAIIFLDSDDVLAPECIDCFVRVLEANPAVGVVYSDAALVDAKGNLLCLYSQALPGARPSGAVLGELARRNFLTIASMVRRDFLGGVRFDEGLECAEDYDFWRQLAVKCEFHYVNRPLLSYRIHDAMTVSNQLANTLNGEAEVQRRIMEMPEFAALQRRERARAYCIHGIKQAMLGKTAAARTMFRQAMRTAPTSIFPYPLWLTSLFGCYALQCLILKRRQLAGNRLGTPNGMSALMSKRTPPRQSAKSKERHRESGQRGIMVSAGETI
jgi:glycosyltransferase involved in cell wall biosynthesis